VPRRVLQERRQWLNVRNGSPPLREAAELFPPERYGLAERRYVPSLSWQIIVRFASLSLSWQVTVRRVVWFVCDSMTTQNKSFCCRAHASDLLLRPALLGDPHARRRAVKSVSQDRLGTNVNGMSCCQDRLGTNIREIEGGAPTYRRGKRSEHATGGGSVRQGQ
jgi:hypothetical protein